MDKAPQEVTEHSKREEAMDERRYSYISYLPVTTSPENVHQKLWIDSLRDS